MPRTDRRRRRKRRGTQSGRIDTRGRARPRNRAEAKARARARSQDRRGRSRTPRQGPPTWRGAINRGLIAAAIFLVLLALLFRRPIAEALALSVFMLVVYIPMGYYLDRFFYRLRQRREQRQREKRQAERDA
jgi:hypothetical protein